MNDKVRLSGLFKTIFLATMFSMLIPLVVVSALTINTVKGNLISSTNENLQQLAIEKADELNAIIDNQMMLVYSVANSPIVREITTEKYNSGDLSPSQVLNDYYTDMTNNANGMYENFFSVAGTMGIADGINGATLHDCAGEVWVDPVYQNGIHLGTDISPVTGLPVFNVVYPVYDAPGGNMVGAVNNAMSLGAVTNTLVNSFGDSDKRVIILNNVGVVMASKNPDEILQLDFAAENETTKAVVAAASAAETGIVEFTLGGVKNVGAFRAVNSLTTLVYMPVSSYMAQINRTINYIVIAALICFVIASFVIILIILGIIRPLTRMVGLIEQYGNADFSRPVPEDLIRRPDEIGTLGKSMAKMQATIRNVFSDIIDETDSVSNNLNASGNKLTDLSDRIEKVNTLTAERAAEMEKTAASTEQINQNAQSIKNSVDNITNETEKGMSIVDAINERATGIKADAVRSQQEITRISGDLRDKLNEAVEQSKAVNRIEELSEAIMEIASETNLLSLNASIEAARAGEAGKGFAVVAEQIGKLAETSQNTVAEIQEVTKTVIDAVNNLADNSQKTVQFIDENVIGDYQTMVDMGQHYSDDAEAIRDLVETINSSADALSQTVTTISESIGEVTVASSEGAAGSNEISKNTSDILGVSSEVSGIMDEVQDSTQKLKDTVNKLTV